MEKTVYYILTLLVLLNFNLYSQDGSKINSLVNKAEQYYLQKDVDLSYSDLLHMKLIEYLNYSDAFKYHKELINNKYFIDSNSINNISINFLSEKNSNNKKNANNKKNYNTITFIKGKVNVNGAVYRCLTLKGDEEQFVDHKNVLLSLSSKMHQFDKSFQIVNYIWRPKILIDKEIVNLVPFGYGNFGKILNRNVTSQNLVTIDNQPCYLFSDVSDGTLLTFVWENQQVMAKVFCVDKIWNRVVWFDQNFSHPYAHSFGSEGSGINQFRYPSGITRSNNYVVSGPNTYDYSIYVADQGNNRIVKFVYEVKYYSNPINHWIFDIKPNSFSVIRNITEPLDLEFHQGTNSNNQNFEFEVDGSENTEDDDVLWYTTTLSGSNSLCSISATNGTIYNEVNHYYYNGQIYPLSPSKISVYRSPNGQDNVLACIDRNENSVVFFKLNPDGKLPNNVPTTYSVFKFTNSERLTSVKLLTTNPVLGLNAYVTFDNLANGFISVFKVYLIGGTPIADYLASYWKGFNSDVSFKNLRNLAIQDGFIDIFTIEDWDNTYGVRRYKPSLDTLYTQISDFCSDRKTLNVKIKVTNNCYYNGYIRFFDGTIWHTISHAISGLSSINGLYVLSTGTNEFTLCNIQINNLNNKSNAQALKYNFELSPIDEGFSGTNKICKTFDNVPINACNGNGGCPYIFVDDGSEMIQDNNILHRSEFADSKGIDIEDKYRLNITPSFNNADSICSLSLRELNNDISSIDKIELKAIDHPAGSVVGITENKDVVIYFPVSIINPTNGELNNIDITCNLQYDSLCRPVNVDSSDVINTSNDGKKNNKSDRYYFKAKIIDYIVNETKKRKNKTDISVNSFNPIMDSLAVILDGSHLPSIIGTAKDYAGTLNAFGSDQQYSSGEKKFARRENNSTIIIPVGKDIVIDSVCAVFNSNSVISYFCTVPIFYDGFYERQADLYSAENFNYGDEKGNLLGIDGNYAILDNQADLNLCFSKPVEQLPDGWIRDYVLIVTGKYEKYDDKKTTDKFTNNKLIPKVFKLHQNYPNPFNPLTTIKYDIPTDSKVSIVIYDILGREVKNLLNENREAGYYEIKFDGSNYASGIYFYRINAGSFVQVKKMVLIK